MLAVPDDLAYPRSRWLSRVARLRELLCVATLAMVLLCVLWTHVPAITEGSPLFHLSSDIQAYITVATSDPRSFHIAPFCWRLLEGLIVRALPIGLQGNFLLITVCSLAATAVALYYLLRQMGFSRELAILGEVLFLASPVLTRIYLSDFWAPDPLAFLFMVLALHAVVSGRDRRFVALLTVGVLAKEGVLFIAPLAYTLRAQRPIDARLAARVALLATPAILLLMGLHAIIPAWNGWMPYTRTLPPRLLGVTGALVPYSVGDLVRQYGLPRLHTLSPYSLLVGTVAPLGAILTALPLLGWRQNRRWLPRFAPFVALIWGQLLVAQDVRLVGFVFPALIVFAVNGADTLARTARLSPLWICGLPLVIYAQSLAGGPIGNFVLPQAPQVGALACAVATVGFLRLRYANSSGGTNPRSCLQPESQPQA